MQNLSNLKTLIYVHKSIFVVFDFFQFVWIFEFLTFTMQVIVVRLSVLLIFVSVLLIFVSVLLNQVMNAKHIFVCYAVIPSKLTKFLVPMGVETKIIESQFNQARIPFNQPNYHYTTPKLHYLPLLLRYKSTCAN